MKSQLKEASCIFVARHIIDMEKGEEVCKAIGADYAINDKSRGWKTRMIEKFGWDDIAVYSTAASYVHKIAEDVLKEWKGVPKKVLHFL